MNEVQADPIDRWILTARCLNDPEFVRQLLNLFATNAPQNARKLRAALDSADLREATRMAHTLKGSGANMAAESLRRVAGEVERLLRDGQTEAAKSLLPLIEGEVRRCVQFVPELMRRL